MVENGRMKDCQQPNSVWKSIFCEMFAMEIIIFRLVLLLFCGAPFAGTLVFER
jgi:hypothetical protein